MEDSSHAIGGHVAGLGDGEDSAITIDWPGTDDRTSGLLAVIGSRFV